MIVTRLSNASQRLQQPTRSDWAIGPITAGAMLPLVPAHVSAVPQAGRVEPHCVGFLNETGKTWPVKGGITKIALVHDLDMNNTTPGALNNSTIAMAEDSTHKPYLTVQYTLP